VFGWRNIHKFTPSQYLLMHALVYRTDLLRQHTLVLPEHCFYVDNIFAWVPLPFVKTMYYLNVDLYRYSTGRPDQSVNEKMMVARIEQQVRVTELMIDAYNMTEVYVSQPKLGRYMTNYLSMMMGISSVFLFLEGSKESITRQTELWRRLRARDKRFWKRLKRRVPSILTSFKGRLGRKFSIWLYRNLRRIYKYN
jgi:hypothetical protein